VLTQRRSGAANPMGSLITFDQTATAETRNVHGRGAEHGSASTRSLRPSETTIRTFSARLATGNSNHVIDDYRGLDGPSGIRAGRTN
jgi:hypothetical protein